MEKSYSMNQQSALISFDSLKPKLLGAKFLNERYERNNKKQREDRILSLKFHIESDDFFGTLATILDALRQEIRETSQRQTDLLARLTDDLLYLQENYKIDRKRFPKRKNED